MKVKYTKLMATLAVAGAGLILVKSSVPLQVESQTKVGDNNVATAETEKQDTSQTKRIEIEIGGITYLVDEKAVIKSPLDVYETSPFLQDVCEKIENYQPIDFINSFLETNKIQLQDTSLRFDPNNLEEIQACLTEYEKVYEALDKDEDSLRFQYLYYPKRDEDIDFDEPIQKKGAIEYLVLNKSYLTQETRNALLEKYQIKEDKIPDYYINDDNCDPLLIRTLAVESCLYNVLGINSTPNTIEGVLDSVNGYYEAKELVLDDRLLSSLELVIEKGNEKYLDESSREQDLSVRDRYYFGLLPELKKQTDFESYRSRVLENITGKELETYNKVK